MEKVATIEELKAELKRLKAEEQTKETQSKVLFIGMLLETQNELDKRQGKLDAYALQLKNEKAKYKQEIESSFEDLLNKAIKDKQDSLDKEKQDLQKQEAKIKDLESSLKNRQSELESEYNLKKQKLNSEYKSSLESFNQEKMVEYENKLNKEMQEKVTNSLKQNLDSIHKEKEQLQQKQLELKNKEDALNIEKQKLDNDKKELEHGYKESLAEWQRQEETKYKDKLEKEFEKHYGNKVQQYEKDKENLENQKSEFEAQKLSLESKLESAINENSKILEEYNDLQSLVTEKELYANRDLNREIENLKQDNQNLTNRLEAQKKETQEIMAKREIEFKKYETMYQDKISKIERYEELEIQLNNLEIEKEKMQEQLREQGYYQRELQIAEDKLERLQKQFMGEAEKEKREEVIKKEWAINITLDDENKIKNTKELEWLDSIESNIKDYGVAYPQRLLYAFHTDLKCAYMSPLSVLSGVSGTGKSELPKLYAYFGGFNFISEAVQPTWDSPSSMIGFYNTIEGKFDSTTILKFLVQTSISMNDKDKNAYGLKESMNLILLDELNLAHIELYFAEFLSKFEIKRGNKNVNLDIPIGAGCNMQIPLDSNLLWVGSMNEDETTKSLSDKVLDRAYCLNFPRPNELKSRPKLKTLDEIESFRWLPKSTWESWVVTKMPQDIQSKLDEYKEITESINKALGKAHRAIGHRVWQSMVAYMINYPSVKYGDNKDKGLQTAFEDQIVQKIMPKLRGIELHGEELKALNEIRDIIVKKVSALENDFNYAMSNPYGQFKFNSADYLNTKESSSKGK